MTDKSPQAFRTISEVAEELDLPQHVLRFWETKFSQIRPMKRSSGRRFYRPEDVELVRTIRDLLYGQGYTIRGVQKLLKERRAVEAAGRAAPPEPDDAAFDEEFFEAGEAESHSEPSIAADMVAELRAMREDVQNCLRILQDARQPAAD